MKEIIIGSRAIGPNQPPFIVAEMSGNHGQSLEKALDIVEAAAKAGADAIKLQTYTPDTMTIDVREGEFYISDSKNLWNGHTLYELYQKAYTPWEWHEPIFKRCQELGIIAFSSPFDESAVDFLEQFDVPCYKIASFEITDLPLIRRVAKTGKPIIISTGMATVGEIDEAVRTARSAGCEDIILLKCTSSYPASPEESNIATLPHLKELFNCQVGVSDHTLGIGVSVASVALGAVMIEKHFTTTRADGVDAAFSLEPDELKMLVEESKKAWQSIGRIYYGPTSSEKLSLIHRRSLYVVQDIKKGEKFTRDNIRAIRPGLGLPAKYFDIVLGKTAKIDLKKGTPLSWEYI